MQKYRKKPVVVECMQLDRGNGPRLAELSGGRWVSLYGRGDRGEDISHVVIPTLEGDVRAELGDWIICGTRGEWYPCKPGPFEDTFERVS